MDEQRAAPQTPIELPGATPPPADEPPAHASIVEEQPRRDQTRIEQPGKLMRLAVMIRETLDEVRRAPLDAGARGHLAEHHQKIIHELRDSLSEPLAEELDRLTLEFNGEGAPSEATLRIAQAQLLGWLEGLFQGIQAAIASQQAAMVQQLEEMRRRSLPPGDEHPQPGPGQYL